MRTRTLRRHNRISPALQLRESKLHDPLETTTLAAPAPQFDLHRPPRLPTEVAFSVSRCARSYLVSHRIHAAFPSNPTRKKKSAGSVFTALHFRQCQKKKYDSVNSVAIVRPTRCNRLVGCRQEGKDDHQSDPAEHTAEECRNITHSPSSLSQKARSPIPSPSPAPLYNPVILLPAPKLCRWQSG